jgi:hypothetical protein
MRAVVVVVLVVCALATPPIAGAHSRGRAIALDFRLSLIASGETVPGVRAQVVDGNREMRLAVDPRRRVVVRGLLGEPVLRFSPSGVWANRRSPTAEADGIVISAGGGAHWTQLTHGHSYRWHDHRLSPPADMQPGGRRAWSLPLTVDGRSASIRGWYERVTRPRWWAWLTAIIVVGGILPIVAQRAPKRGGPIAGVVATLSAVAAFVIDVGFAVPDIIDPHGAWIQAAATAALVVIGAAALFVRRHSIQRWAAACVGIGAFFIGLSYLSVFWHGVIISSFPPGAVRLATALAVVGGSSAAMLGLVEHEEESPRAPEPLSVVREPSSKRKLFRLRNERANDAQVRRTDAPAQLVEPRP